MNTVRPKLRPDLAAIIPPRMAALPVDVRGFPIPWFVAFINGEPDFRVVRENRLALAYNRKTCWLCGKLLGIHKVFVIGPMCAITRVTSEPPSHRACAEFAVKACPFLSRPMAKRDDDLPAGVRPAAGIHLDRNPGAAALWITKGFKPFHAPRPDGSDGTLFKMGEPDEVTWWAQGRQATREEIDQSIRTGLPFLLEVAGQEGDAALLELTKMVVDAERLLPA